jgi:hypothetical protein
MLEMGMRDGARRGSEGGSPGAQVDERNGGKVDDNAVGRVNGCNEIKGEINAEQQVHYEVTGRGV